MACLQCTDYHNAANVTEEYLLSCLVKPADAPEEYTDLKDSKCQNYHKRYKRCALDLGATSVEKMSR